MENIISKDGTPIAYEHSGAGPPLVLVHGMAGSHARWETILPTLRQHFSVYAVDRRGRGESGDADTYAIEREFEDIAVVVDSVGEQVNQQVNLLGHSYGAICSLEAALLSQNIHKMVLYEPGLPLEGFQIYPEGIIERLQALMDAGDREGVLVTFAREVVEIPSSEIALLQSQPAWSARVAAAHTIPRELRAEAQYRFEPERFKNMSTPTLLLTGGESPPISKASVDAVNAALPNSRILVMPGQQHIADQTAPELFLREVLGFLKE